MDRKRKFSVKDLLEVKKKLKTAPRKQTKPTAEVKYLQTTQNSTVVTAGGQTFLLNNPVIGTDYYNRIGRKITSQYVRVKFSAYSTVLGVTPILTQVALVLDKQPVPGTLAAYANIFDVNANGQTTAINYGMPFKNIQQYPDRFDILWSETLPIIGLQLLESFSQDKFRKLIGDIASVRFSGAEIGSYPDTHQLLLCVGTSANTGIAATDASFRYTSLYAFTDE